MKIESLTIETALSLGQSLPWAFVRSLGSVTLAATPVSIQLNELLEARFFAEEQEIRLFQKDGVLCAVRLTQEANDDPITEVHLVEHPNFRGELTVCQDLDADEDGQMFLSSTRLSNWKEACSRV